MASYSSYWLYQKYEKRGDQDWIPSYPNTYSIDGEGTMPLVVRIEKDEACGYVCDEMERWVEVPISQDYVCDDCEVGYLYRWVPCNPSAFTYYGDWKYAILCEEKSEDGGLTWSATTNTKLSSEPIGVAEKKIKLTFYNGDVFAQSCGTDDGVYSPVATNGIYYFQGSVNHTTNVKRIDRDQFFISSFSWPVGGTSVGNQIIHDYDTIIGFKNVRKIEFSDCVTSIGLKANNGEVTMWPHGMDRNQVLGSGWDISEVVFPDTLKSIVACAFADNKIETLNIPSSVERIGNDWDCIIWSTGSDCTISGTFAFNRRLKNVNLGEWNGTKHVSSLKTIGKYDFMYCSALETIRIPDSLEGWGSNVFTGCTNLKQIIFEGTTPPGGLSGQSGAAISSSINDDVCLYVPCDALETYKNAYSSWPENRIFGYGGSCGNIPSVSSMYNLVTICKVGNQTYNVYRGAKVSPSYQGQMPTLNVKFFEELKQGYAPLDYCSLDGYGKIDEIIITQYARLENDNPLYDGALRIDGCKKLTLNCRYGNNYNYGEPRGIQTDAEEIEFNTGIMTFWGPSFTGSTTLKKVTINDNTTFKGAFQNSSNLSSVTINWNCYLEYGSFADCPNLTDVYINYSGGVVTLNAGSEAYNVPFVGSNPTVHVPCELYELYKAHSIWGRLNIVKNSDDCDPGYIRIVSNTFSQASASDPIISDRYIFSKQTVYYGGNGAEMTLVCKDVQRISFETVRCGAASNSSVLTMTLDGVEVFNRDSYRCSVQQQKGAGYVGGYTMTGLDDGVEHTIVIHSNVRDGRDNYFGFDAL